MKPITLLLLIALFSDVVMAEKNNNYDSSTEKSYTEEFKVDKNAMLKVSNMFGSIEIINWNENKVNIEVEVKVETESESKAQKALDGIDVSFKGTRSLVEAYTEMDKNICNNNCDIEVNYTIKMPASMKVDLLQKFGDIRIEELEGEAKLGVKYGDLIVRRLNASSNEIFVKFGNAELEYISRGNLQIEYSDISIDEAVKLDITSSYSELGIERVKDLVLNSSYDDVEIESVETLVIESGFSESEIESIGKSLNAKLRYGNLEVNDVADDFTKIEIDTEFADVELGIRSNASYQLVAETKFGEVEYPDNSRITIEKKGYTESRYKGFVGDDGGTTTSITIYAKHANVELN